MIEIISVKFQEDRISSIFLFNKFKISLFYTALSRDFKLLSQKLIRHTGVKSHTIRQLKQILILICNKSLFGDFKIHFEVALIALFSV